MLMKKLRWQFVKVAMLALSIVLFLLLAAVNAVNAVASVKNLDGLLQVMQLFDGTLPEERQANDAVRQWNFRYTEETPFATRFFVVFTDGDLQVKNMLMEHIAAVSMEEAQALVEQVSARGNPRGFEGVFRYLIDRGEDGNCRFFFLDAGGVLQDVRTLLGISAAIFILALSGVFTLVWFFSRRVAQPIVDGMEKQKQFMSNAEHEFKTPLTIISASADVLSGEIGPNSWLDSIIRQTERMSGLMHRMLLLSRLDETAPPLEMKRLNLKDVADSCLEQARELPEAETKTVETQSMEEAWVNGNEALLGQCLMILLDNALRHSSGSGEIRLCLQRQHGQAALSISNVCADLDSLRLDRIFDRFYRGDASRSRKTGGSGLGLAIAREIAQRHRGDLTARREEDRLIFCLTLPAQER